jgi:hypothetical protein
VHIAVEEYKMIMKREYTKPTYDIEKFKISCSILTSETTTADAGAPSGASVDKVDDDDFY